MRASVAFEKLRAEEPRANYRKLFGTIVLFTVLVVVAITLKLFTHVLDRALGLDKKGKGLFNPF